MHDINLLYVLIGVFAGTISGLLSVGGGSFVMSMLLYLFTTQGIEISAASSMAVATALATVCLNSAVFLCLHFKSIHINWNIFFRFTISMCLGGLLLSPFIGTYLNGKTITFILIGLCLFVSYQMFFKTAKTKTTSQASSNSVLMPHTALILSVPLGALCILAGISGGGVTLSLLNMSYSNIDENISTAAAIGFPLSLLGISIYILQGLSAINLPSDSLGYVHLPALFYISIPSLICTFIGVKVSKYVNRKYIRLAMGALMLSISINLIYNLGLST